MVVQSVPYPSSDNYGDLSVGLAAAHRRVRQMMMMIIMMMMMTGSVRGMYTLLG